MAALLALLTSLGYGSADFLAGRLARRLEPTLMVLYSQALQAAVVLLFALSQPLAPAALLWGVGAGFVNAAGLVLYYQALAGGPAGVVAALVAASMVVPVGVAVVVGTLASPLVLAGLAVVFLGVVVAVRSSGAEPDEPPAPPCRGASRAVRQRTRRTRPAGSYLVPALAAALAFGLFFLLVERGSATAGAGVLWITLGVQLGALPPTLVRALSGGRGRLAVPERSVLLPLGGLSVLNLGADVALAYALAAGNLGVVSVLASLGPVVTGVLARTVSGERLSRSQLVGAGLTLLGTLLVVYPA